MSISHVTATIEDRSAIGEDTSIWQHVVILKGAKIGRDCNICACCFIEGDVVVGDRVTIKNGVQLWDGLRVEDDVFIGPNATFVNDHYPRSKQHLTEHAITILRRGCSIGANSTILDGITIGEYAMIGAGSVVTKNVQPYELVRGNPARHHGFICKCKGKLRSADATCGVCGTSYYSDANGLKPRTE